MAGRLALLLCASSVAWALAGQAAPARVRPLTQQQLEQPDQVAAWLRQHAATADRQRADEAALFGAAEARRGDLGSAVKGYGLSAVLYPSPAALNAYAGTLVRYLGQLRARRMDRARHLDQDLASVEALYRAALASDTVLAALPPAERVATLANADCVAAYRHGRAAAGTCAPLRAYGLAAAERRR